MTRADGTEDAAAAAAAVAGGLQAALPALAQTVAEIEATLRRVGADGAQQLRAIETMLAAVQARNLAAAAEADRGIAQMTALMTRIDALSAANTSAIAARAYALDAAVDGVLERVTLAFDAIGERVAERLMVLQAAVDAAGGQLDLLGEAGTRAFEARLDLLVRTSERLRAEMAAQEAASVRLHGLVTGHVDGLEARLRGVDLSE